MMAHASRPEMIVPNPQAAKTLGMLSIIFASLILTCDTCTGFGTIFGTAAARVMEINFRSLQSQINATFKQEERALQKKVATAKTDGDKASAQRELDNFKAQPRPVIPNTMNSTMATFKDPVIAAERWVSLGTSLVLNGLMLAGGIGLLVLAEWGRKLTIWVAVLKIARLALLVLATVVVIMPRTTQVQMEQFREIEKQQKAANGGRPVPGPDMAQMGKFAIASSYASVLSYYLVAPIFPIILLVALNRRRVRAAFYRPKVKPELDFS